MKRTVFWATAMMLLAGAANAGDGASFEFPVPLVNIQAGDVIPDDLIVTRRLFANEAALKAHHIQRAGVVGMVARRMLPAGSAIPLNAVRDVYIFKEGDRVVLELSSGGLMIRCAAIALQPGVAGRLVRVRNLDTGVIVSGIVRSDGSVDVGGG